MQCGIEAERRERFVVGRRDVSSMEACDTRIYPSAKDLSYKGPSPPQKEHPPLTNVFLRK